MDWGVTGGLGGIRTPIGRQGGRGTGYRPIFIKLTTANGFSFRQGKSPYRIVIGSI